MRVLAVARQLVNNDRAADLGHRRLWLVGIVAPIVIAAPGYFGGQLTFGQLMMVVGAFNQVQGFARWFVDNFSAIADWRATLAVRHELPRGADDARGAQSRSQAPDP